MSNIQLNHTVNESGNTILQKLRRPEKRSRPMTRYFRPTKQH